jgi:hypothetical protein
MWTADEMIDDYQRYSSTLTNSTQFGLNIAYNLGAIYDRVFELVGMFDPELVLIAPHYIYMGSLAGRIFYNMLFPKVYPEVVIEYPEDPDLTLYST